MRRYDGLMAALLALLLLSIAGPRRALAQGPPPPVPNLVGHWTGLTLSSSSQNVAPITLDMAEQHELLVKGTAELGGVAFRAYAEMKPRTPWFTDVLVHVFLKNELMTCSGELVTLGQTFGLKAQYTVGPVGKPTATGSLIAVQCLGGQNWMNVDAPDVTSTRWCGWLLVHNLRLIPPQDVPHPMDASFNSEVGSALGGSLSFPDLFPDNGIPWAFAGTISAAGSIKGIAIEQIGEVQPNFVIVSGQLNLPGDGSITGTLHWVFNQGANTVDTTFTLFPCNSPIELPPF